MDIAKSLYAAPQGLEALDMPDMEIEIASTLKIDVELVNIKATTTEKLGFEGREEGISVQAVVLIQKS